MLAYPSELIQDVQKIGMRLRHHWLIDRNFDELVQAIESEYDCKGDLPGLCSVAYTLAHQPWEHIETDFTFLAGRIEVMFPMRLIEERLPKGMHVMEEL